MLLQWNQPEQTFGSEILSYEIIYEYSSQLFTTNIPPHLYQQSYQFNITSLALGSIVSNISVRAYSNLGYGRVTYLPDQLVREQGESLMPTQFMHNFHAKLCVQIT